MEFCEVASMSMELLGSEHFDVFYSNPADSARARRKLLEGIVGILPWIAIIDSFQHWLYTTPDPSGPARTDEWLRLMDRFWPDVDWSGYEPARACHWQRQLHLFHAPFYYVEYGIAQLGALQLWLKARARPPRRARWLPGGSGPGRDQDAARAFCRGGNCFRFLGEDAAPADIGPDGRT